MRGGGGAACELSGGYSLSRAYLSWRQCRSSKGYWESPGSRNPLLRLCGERQAESGERRAERRVRMIVAKQLRSADKFYYCFSPAAVDQTLGGVVFETHHLGSNLQGKRLGSFGLEHFPRSLLGVLSTPRLNFVYGLELHWRSIHLREPNSDEDTNDD
jgi:hypothetical protein